MHTLFSGGALARAKRSQLSTMGKKISLSMHPRKFAFDKIVRKNRLYFRFAGSGVQIEAMFLFKFSPVTSYAQSQAQSSSLEMASLVAFV